jgi:phage shock protein C
MKKKLRRDQEQAVISGVLAGMANYWNQDPVLFRVGAIVFLVLTGFFPGLLLYIGAWIVMPQQKADTRKVDYEVSE